MVERSRQDPEEQRETFWSLIKDIKFAMFTTRGPNGELRARPMTTQNKPVDEGESLWFFMSRSSGPVADLERDGNVGVLYASPDDDAYVSVTGSAKVVDDPAKKQALWNRLNDAWFKNGVNDPDVALVRVTIAQADYWNVKENKLMQLVHMAAAAVSGKTPELSAERATLRV